MQKSRQRVRDYGWGLLCVQPMNMGGEGNVWFSRHSNAIKAVLAGQLECSIHCKTPASKPQEGVIRNKDNGF